MLQVLLAAENMTPQHHMTILQSPQNCKELCCSIMIIFDGHNDVSMLVNYVEHIVEYIQRPTWCVFPCLIWCMLGTVHRKLARFLPDASMAPQVKCWTKTRKPFLDSMLSARLVWHIDSSIPFVTWFWQVVLKLSILDCVVWACLDELGKHLSACLRCFRV